ncbi:MAG: hypothetical protein IPI53_01510 [Saprospiraceae bacterium]|nr:hypothetical protein [Saprospiraceae bacterium]MBK8370743.1 hypothetical protein [Saprospiraceae bacterium]MBK8852784.1 hypothetical protein [Saprospiraceae bacterium]MBK9044637.1 hypothetical protein [Saprospiraceae bacterium]
MIFSFRFLFFAFLFELCILYTMQAESVTAGNLIQLNEKIQTQEGDFLSPGGLERNDGPFELIPGDEKEEISEEESSSRSGYDAVQFFPLRTALNVDRCISKKFLRNHARFFTLPLYLVFQNWKIHI